MFLIECYDGSKELKEYFTENPLKDKEIKVTIERGGETQELAMTPVLSSKGYSMGFSYNSARVEASPLETLEYSFAEIKYQITSVFKSLGR